MRRKRILSQKRPAAGEEARERASFLFHRILRPVKKQLYLVSEWDKITVMTQREYCR